MSRPIVQTWTKPDTTAIANLQSLGGAGNLLLNGAYSNNSGTIILPNMTRKISFTSGNNLSGSEFTVTGSVRGMSVTETLVGPNNDTVESVEIYDTITSISVDSAVNGISVGTGADGHLNWILYDYNRVGSSLLSVQIMAAGDINYEFGATLQDITKTIDNYITFDTTGELEDATGNATAFAETGLRYYTIFINNSDENGTLTAYYMQQGI